jgi:hypothetical protein
VVLPCVVLQILIERRLPCLSHVTALNGMICATEQGRSNWNVVSARE